MHLVRVSGNAFRPLINTQWLSRAFPLIIMQNKLKHSELRESLKAGNPTPFVGIYDVFSASLVAKHQNHIFVSGFGFGASHYGLPDAGFITWTDLVDFVQRVRKVAPSSEILVDIDDGFGDSKVACHVAQALEDTGAFGIVLEDQPRPRKCGHLGGKQVLPMDEYLIKLETVLKARDKLFVVARTDADSEEEILRRVEAYAAAGADAVLADGITDLNTIAKIRSKVKCPIAFNQIAGGKSPEVDLDQLKALGAAVIIYSTPCLFAAHRAIEDALTTIKASNGSLSQLLKRDVDLATCNEQLEKNRSARYHSKKGAAAPQI